MASLYKRKDSPHWHLRAKIKGAWRSENTGLRTESPRDTKRARILCAEATFAEESRTAATAVGSAGWSWVPAFLKHRAPSAKTLDSYRLRWRHLSRFFVEADIDDAVAVRREHAQAWLEWRMAQKRPASGKTACKNTALVELKLWKQVMAEAVARGFCTANPLAGLKLPKDAPAEKPEITAEEEARIAAALVKEPRWMRRAWQIAMATGCRLRETRIEARQADLDAGTLHFPAPKGGKKKAYTVPLPGSLRPLFVEMQRRRERWTLDFPFQPSRQWRLFFDRLGLRHVCFHCTRVTFVSRLARAGAPLGVAMALVNHSSELVHRLYRRTRADELTGWADRVAALGDGATPRNPLGKSAARSAGTPAGARACKRPGKSRPIRRPVAAR